MDEKIPQLSASAFGSGAVLVVVWLLLLLLLWHSTEEVVWKMA